MTFAAKSFDKVQLTKSRGKQKVMNEIRIINKMNHQNIVRFDSYFEDTNRIYMLMDYCSNKTLYDLVKKRKRLSDLEVKSYTRQIIEGLKYLRQTNVVHRDIKLSNVYLSENMEAKIGDFGLSIQLDHPGQRLRHFCGTPNYIAPEMLEGDLGHSHEVDVWALGVIIYIMLTGRKPFQGRTNTETYNNILSKTVKFPSSLSINPKAIDLLMRIFRRSPLERIDIYQVENHPFLNGPGVIPRILR